MLHARFAAPFGCALLLTTALLAGCDAAPGLPDAPGRPPVIRALALAPNSIRLDSLDAESITGDSLVVAPLAIVADAFDPDGSIDSVLVILQDGNGEAVFQQRMEASDGAYKLQIALVFDPNAVRGRFGVLAIAVDEQGQTASARGVLTITNPLVREAAVEPQAFRRDVDTLLTVTARVVHPDGSNAVARVLAQVVGAENVIELADDGSEESGDLVANDGIYTGRSTHIPSVIGDLPVVVQAVDVNGFVSDLVVVRTTVQ